MYYLKKTLTISASHSLNLTYQSPCQNIHGHNWKITIYCKSEKLNESGMIIDFSEIKKIVNKLDHLNINEILKQPTAELMAEYFCNNIPFCYKVDIEETEGSVATYVR